MKKMSDMDKRPDQAENLRTKMIDDYKELHGNFPPRGEVHKDKVEKKTAKLKYPIISILAVFFFLVPILIYLLYGINGNEKPSNQDPEGDYTVYIPKVHQSDENPDSNPVDGSESPVEEETNDIDKEIVEEKNEKKEEVDVTNEVVTNSNDVDTKEKETLEQNKKESVGKETETETETETDNTTENEPEYREIKTHTVKTGETLFKIAIMYYNSREGEEIIRKYNGITANNIYVGQKIKIPLK